MAKFVRKIANSFAAREDRDARRTRSRFLSGVVEAERAHFENIGRAWRSRQS